MSKFEVFHVYFLDRDNQGAVIASYESDMPIPVPRVGETVDLWIEEKGASFIVEKVRYKLRDSIHSHYTYVILKDLDTLPFG